MKNPLSLPPALEAVVLEDIAERPGDVMKFKQFAPGAVDNERAIVWVAPNGQTIVTAGWIDDHPWYPVHKITVLLCNSDGTPTSPAPQAGSRLGIIDHRAAAEDWWQLSAAIRAKWQHALDVLALMPVDDQHRPTLPVTPELESVLRLTLPWMPKTVWPEWCRRAFATKAGVLVHANGQPFANAIGTTPPAAMVGTSTD